MMTIWGILSNEDRKAGFDLVLDDNWYVLLLDKDGKIMSRFDPRDYTLDQLNQEVADTIHGISLETSTSAS